MPQQRPDQLTPVAVSDLYDALGAAWRARFGEEAPRRSLLVLLAQWAEETGRGRAMHCFNLGNIKGRPDGSDGRDWTFFRCNEVIDGRVRWFDPPDPACCFRAYGTLEAGAADYLDELARRFASAWPAVLAGDPADFAHRLKAARYYTADEHAYAAALVSLVREFDRIVTVPPPAPTGDVEQLVRVLKLEDDLAHGKEGLAALEGLDAPPPSES